MIITYTNSFSRIRSYQLLQYKPPFTIRPKCFTLHQIYYIKARGPSFIGSLNSPGLMPRAASLTGRPKEQHTCFPQAISPRDGWLNSPGKGNSSPLLLAHAAIFRGSLPGVRTNVKQFMEVIAFFSGGKRIDRRLLFWHRPGFRVPGRRTPCLGLSGISMTVQMVEDYRERLKMTDFGRHPFARLRAGPEAKPKGPGYCARYAE
jgi:hypothetical protein